MGEADTVSDACPSPAACREIHLVMNILIVDDSPKLARVTAVALRLLDCETVIAESIAAAQHLLATESIDAILLDINLRGESGMDFLSQLVSQSIPIPIVAFTALNNEDTIAEALRRGALSCLIKPFNLDDLRFHVQRIEQYRQQRAQSLNCTAPKI